eukprot:CAMPEP_0196160778 /NCGR_PEP_ID=MMETSP0910-20130528/46998_1 /TAXON_ID=49265 /ORGANISM="Thalassiosira rotula, Strain GSO102" /LENGTH=1086 /DNA_ID=CAMNT_0041425717 /DNA_START=1 /DNA_END=3261 /DNA_ORIENTATION=+
MEVTIDFLAQAIKNKPTDGSDCKTLAEAQKELGRLRRVTGKVVKVFRNSKGVHPQSGAAVPPAPQYPKQDEGKKKTSSIVAHNDVAPILQDIEKKHGEEKRPRPRSKRNALTIDHSFKVYKKTTVEKSSEDRALIKSSIKKSSLFNDFSDLEGFIDVFTPKSFEEGTAIVRQGETGDSFYVVHSGALDIFVNMGDGRKKTETQVGVPYRRGGAFGELALLYDVPQASTIRASEDSALWEITRMAFRGLRLQIEQKAHKMKLKQLESVKIGKHMMSEIMDLSQLESMAMAAQYQKFEAGAIIVKEGEIGNTFYMITKGEVGVYKKTEGGNKKINTLGVSSFFGEKGFFQVIHVVKEGEIGNTFYMITKGEVDVYKKSHGNNKIASLGVSSFFGEKALLSYDTRQATCIAATNVECLTLCRDDFVRMLGNLDDVIAGKKTNILNRSVKMTPSFFMKQDTYLSLSDLKFRRVLGEGAFGKVNLVKSKIDGKLFALKAQSKAHVIEKGSKEKLITEYRIMSELSHPTIVECYQVFQDRKYIFFLMGLLPGGEVLDLLYKHEKFPESWTRFYGATIVLFFEYIHEQKIAYRDLKPENLVLDENGYCRVVDLGLTKSCNNGKTWTMCGTPDYLAPEIITGKGHDWGVDYWAFGVLLYELCYGMPPFHDANPMNTAQNVMNGSYSIPPHFSRLLVDLVSQLLTYQSKRLGGQKAGLETVNCLALARDDFVLMLGNMEDLLSGQRIPTRKESIVMTQTSFRKDQTYIKLSLNDLNIKGVLGNGEFGKVNLVKCQLSGKLYALKVQSKAHIVERECEDKLVMEFQAMSFLNHPFIESASKHFNFQAFQDKKYIYFLMGLLPGGEVLDLLHEYENFPESWVRFYSATIVLVFEYIHEQKIAYRDLKPENLVLDEYGYCRVVDLGLAKRCNNGKTWTLCGTPDYLAPEVFRGKGHDWGVDYWALGVLIYELCYGLPPFYDENRIKTAKKVIKRQFWIPPHFTHQLVDIVSRLLTDQSKRLGRTRNGVSGIKKHAWFAGFDWQALLDHEMKAPWVPDLGNLELLASKEDENWDAPDSEWQPNLDMESNRASWMMGNSV